MNEEKKQTKDTGAGSNADQQGVDKAPGEERGKSELVTKNDLKGKKIDADPADAKDQPSKQ